MKNPMLWGALLNLLGFPIYMDWLVFSKIYGGYQLAVSDALGYFIGITLHMLAAAVIVRLCIISKPSKSLYRIIVGAVLILWGAFVLLLAFMGHFGAFNYLLYERFYAEALGFRLYINSFMVGVINILYDTNIFFFWLSLLSVFSAEKQHSFREVGRFCVGGLISCAVLFAIHIIVGQSEYWRLLHWHSLPDAVDNAVDIIFGVVFGIALAVCGIWHIRGSRRNHTPDEICEHGEE